MVGGKLSRLQFIFKLCADVVAAHSEKVHIRCVQQEVYQEEFWGIRNGMELSKNSSLFDLSPVVDTNQLLRIGGRIGKSDICNKE